MAPPSSQTEGCRNGRSCLVRSLVCHVGISDLDIPVFKTIGLAVNHLLDILVSKQLQYQEQIIVIQQELRHVLELENI